MDANCAVGTYIMTATVIVQKTQVFTGTRAEIQEQMERAFGRASSPMNGYAILDMHIEPARLDMHVSHGKALPILDAVLTPSIKPVAAVA